MAQQDRTTYLGGSDVAGILNLNPWATPVDIFYRKVPYVSDEPRPPLNEAREKILRRGKWMEPVVIKMVNAEFPLRITKRSTDRKPNRYRDSKLTFMAAEIDFEWQNTPRMAEEYPAIPMTDGTLNGEVKTANPYTRGGYGEQGTDVIPIQYACQAMHGLGITGRDACLVPVLVGSDNLTLYHVLRNEELIKVMREKCEQFWVDHVLKRLPPKPVESEDVYRILRNRNDVVVQADEALSDLVGDLAEANEAKRVATANAEKCQFEVIKALVGDTAVEGEARTQRHVIMRGAETLLTMSRQSRESVQAKLLKAAHPEIYNEYVKTTSFFVCRLTKQKD